MPCQISTPFFWSASFFHVSQKVATNEKLVWLIIKIIYFSLNKLVLKLKEWLVTGKRAQRPTRWFIPDCRNPLVAAYSSNLFSLGNRDLSCSAWQWEGRIPKTPVNINHIFVNTHSNHFIILKMNFLQYECKLTSEARGKSISSTRKPAMVGPRKFPKNRAEANNPTKEYKLLLS